MSLNRLLVFLIGLGLMMLAISHNYIFDTIGRMTRGLYIGFESTQVFTNPWILMMFVVVVGYGLISLKSYDIQKSEK